jgi:hypothetical protein
VIRAGETQDAICLVHSMAVPVSKWRASIHAMRNGFGFPAGSMFLRFLAKVCKHWQPVGSFMKMPDDGAPGLQGPAWRCVGDTLFFVCRLFFLPVIIYLPDLASVFMKYSGQDAAQEERG